MSVQILVGDALAVLKTLPDESVAMCCTSPPYWNLRDYGVAGQIGLEATPAEWCARLVEVLREVRRVLVSTGTVWVNCGDSYAGSWGAQGHRETPACMSHNSIKNHPKRASQTGTIRQQGLKPKDLIGAPWMLAFALRDDGWWLRDAIVWHKPSPMPESVKDRCTKAYEHVFMLAKSERYWFDAKAIAEPSEEVSGWAKQRANGVNTWKYNDTVGRKQSTGQRIDWSTLGKPGIRNCRNVWTIATGGEPFPDSHFAVMPPELARRCILAGCPVGGTVLDPFGGAGTTGLVADRLQRHAILIELNPAYAELARRRIDADRGGLLDIAEVPEPPKPVAAEQLDLMAAGSGV